MGTMDNAVFGTFIKQTIDGRFLKNSSSCSDDYRKINDTGVKFGAFFKKPVDKSEELLKINREDGGFKTVS